jgi:hypothetical protein
MIKKYLFLITLFFLSIKGISQSNYSVTSIPFTQYIASSANLPTQDDHCSSLIALPFNFDFYGVNYNQIVISTNGYIDFRTTSANGYSPFAFSQTIPNVAFPVKNSILGAYTDLNNANAEGTITYGVYGTAPYRKFVVYFYNNSFFSCTTMKSTFQMILHETSNIIDVQLIDKQACPSWNSGRTVTGLINLAGDLGIAAPGRNTGSWTAFHEGWRFSRSGYYAKYSFVRCDDDADGFQSFDLNVAANDLSAGNSSSISFYSSLADAQNNMNQIANASTYSNTSNPQTIYATGNGMIKEVNLSVIDCAIDADADSVGTAFEDVNNDTNLANDDTDVDGLPNYLDNDDDGDLILTNVEYVFSGRNVNAILDTDNDSIPNYLDNDDDGDGVLTFNEDYNGDGNPANDDTNANGTPDYLEMGVALGVAGNEFKDTITLYPNPTSDILNFDNKSGQSISSIAIYAINGALIKEKQADDIQSISVSDLQSGIYFVKVTVNETSLNYKFIKQ